MALPTDFTLIQRSAPTAVIYNAEQTSFNDNYDPRVAQDNEGTTSFVGTPGSNCYSLRTAPFDECANFLSILDKDEKVVSYYNLIVTNITGENVSLEFSEGITRSICNEVRNLQQIGYSLMDSVISQFEGDSYWIDPDQNLIGPLDTSYSDPNIDRTGWRFIWNPGVDSSNIDIQIWSTFKQSLVQIGNAIRPFLLFDITGEIYTGDCTQTYGRPFTVTAGNISSAKTWPEAVAKLGPDAVARGENVDSVNYEEQATFYNLCLQAKECIKTYRADYPSEYQTDVTNLTSEQIQSLNAIENFLDADISSSKAFLQQALTQINQCYGFLTNPGYYSLDGRFNSEVLYRTAIAAAAIRNIATVLFESLVAIETASDITEYNQAIQQLLDQQREEYERKLAEDEAKRAAKQAAMAERFLVCRTAPAAPPVACADKPNDAKTFLENWTTLDRNAPFYAPNEKKYYLVYDVVVEDFTDFTTKVDSFKNETYKILNTNFSLGLPTDPEQNVQDVNVLIKLEEIYYEPRRFKPSKVLFSLDETLLNPPAQVNPRFLLEEESNTFIRSYIFTIREFFEALEGFENILKKYVFDHALWKVTFGNENPAVTNMAIATSPIFTNLKLDLLKQDSKNFQRFRPLFTQLLSMNGIALIDNARIQKTGQFLLDDKLTLVFSFENPPDQASPSTIEGTSVVKPESINTLTKPPTNNAGSGLASGIVAGTKIKLYRVQLASLSRPPTDLLWRKTDGSGSYLEGLNSQDIFKNETAMNYLMNMDILLALLRPNKNDRT
jgi:hypothetical protein